MKTIQKLITVTLLLITSTFGKTDFGAGPQVYAKAYQSVRGGEYVVSGEGLRSGFSTQVFYGDRGVTNSDELMAPLRDIAFTLNFENYRTTIFEKTVLVDENGTSVFICNHSWKPIEQMSTDGGNLTYSIPEYAGSIYLQLADRTLETDADAIEVQLDGGYYVSLSVQEGHVIIPGWVYQQKGVFVEWVNGYRTVTDIQTGLRVRGERKILFTKSSDVDGITVRKPCGLYLSIYSNREWITMFEATASKSGILSLWVGDGYGNSPQGVYITQTNDEDSTAYWTVGKGGMLYVPIQVGATYHLQAVWGPDPGKG